jgi:soluble lytic murein transglycosylase-like protein
MYRLNTLQRQRPHLTPRRKTMGLAALGLFLSLLLVGEAWADIYRYVDRNGLVHLSDRPGGPGWKLYWKSGKKAKARRGSSSYNAFKLNRRKYAPLINDVALRYRLDRALIHAVVRAESAYNPNAKSRAGAVGLMQLMPGTAERYGVNDRYNPTANLTGGVRYLRDLLVQFDDVVLALAAYNAGENAVIKYGKKVPPYPETQTYVRRVLRFYREIRKSS